MARKKRKLKKSFKLFAIFLFCFLLIISFIFFNKSSNVYNVNFDNFFDNIIKNTKKYKKCMEDSSIFDSNDFSDDLKKEEDNIKKLFDNSASFTYYDLTSNYSFSKNGDNVSYAASVNKLPAIYYAYRLADEDKLDLNKELVYTSKYKHGGSGIIQNDPVGSKYTISKLLEYAIRYSDNVAYFMVLDQIGDVSSVRDYWKNIGVNITYTDKFGNLSPNLGVSYLKEIYKYYLGGSDNAKKLFTDLSSSDNMDFVKDSSLSYDVAHKYGWYSYYYNDISIVMTNNPYILSITSTKGFNDTTKSFFLKVHSLTFKFNEDYYKEKGEYCLEKSY